MRFARKITQRDLLAAVAALVLSAFFWTVAFGIYGQVSAGLADQGLIAQKIAHWFASPLLTFALLLVLLAGPVILILFLEGANLFLKLFTFSICSVAAIFTAWTLLRSLWV
jgi:hypothetical protein